MFLDDELYQHTINKVIKDPEDFKCLLNELYRITENKWKPQMYLGIRGSEVKIILDRVFISWELFIKQLNKENYIFIDLLSENSYKITFLKDNECKRIYELCCKKQ